MNVASPHDRMTAFVRTLSLGPPANGRHESLNVLEARRTREGECREGPLFGDPADEVVCAPAFQSVAAPITGSQCGSGGLTDELSVLGEAGAMTPGALSFSGGLDARGASGVVAPDESGNMGTVSFSSADNEKQLR